MTTIPFAQRTYSRSKGQQDTFGDFTCLHCGRLVQSHELLSGVRNRNHCPHCLSSRHLDLYAAGDRLAACKGRMQPVALTLKHDGNKYRRNSGELMLVHICDECGIKFTYRLGFETNFFRRGSAPTPGGALEAPVHPGVGR